MSKVNNKPLVRNNLFVPHKERMALRKEERQQRVRSLPYNHPFFKLISSGKYDPRTEQKKQWEKRKNLTTTETML